MKHGFDTLVAFYQFISLFIMRTAISVFGLGDMAGKPILNLTAQWHMIINKEPFGVFLA